MLTANAIKVTINSHVRHFWWRYTIDKYYDPYETVTACGSNLHIPCHCCHME